MPEKNTVTEVRVPVKHPDRRWIYINDEYVFSLSEDIFFSNPLQVGDILTDGEIEHYQKLDKIYRIKEAAFQLLDYRQRSQREMMIRLRKKGWAQEEITPVIEELIELGYLNDLEFARAFSHDKVKLRKIGPIALRYELYKTGVDKEIIDNVVDEIYEQFPVDSLVQSILKKKGINSGKQLDKKEKKKLVDLLRRKGFNWADIEPFISQLT